MHFVGLSIVHGHSTIGLYVTLATYMSLRQMIVTQDNTVAKKQSHSSFSTPSWVSAFWLDFDFVVIVFYIK
jgi:hypothetical protein